MAGGKSVFIWEAGWEEPFGNKSTFAVSGTWRFCMIIRSLLPLSLETMHDPKEPVLLIAFKIMRHAKLCLSVIMLLFTCVATLKGCAGHCLHVGRGGKFDLLRV